MKTFTVRDLDRSPAKVLAAADRDGVARVRSRDGRTYAVKPETTTTPKPDWAEFAQARRVAIRRLNMAQISKSDAVELDRIISGE